MASTQKSEFLVFGEERSCPLCDHDDRIVLSRKMQFRLDCTTVICRGCGFCFVSPPPTQEAYRRFYRDAYSFFYQKIHRAGRGPVRENNRDRARFETIERFQQIEGADLLEIGPGHGRFLELASCRGANCYAVEPSQEFRKYLASKGIPIMGRFIEELRVDQKFDLVCLFQVLEHMEDPTETTLSLARLLKPGGLLVLDVPNIWKPFRSLDRYFLRYVHLSYFSPNSLSRLLLAQGFEILHLDAGGAKTLQPQPIFVIARKSRNDQPRGAPMKDDAEGLLVFLRSYRRKYWVTVALLFFANHWRRTLRAILSRSIFGSMYRDIRGRN